MTRSDSRNSINDDLRSRPSGGGLSIASMGTGRHSAKRAQTPSSRRGSSVYIGGDQDSGLYFIHILFSHNFWAFFRFAFLFSVLVAFLLLLVTSPGGNLPPTGPASPGWASRPTPTVRRKPSNVSTVSMSEGILTTLTWHRCTNFLLSGIRNSEIGISSLLLLIFFLRFLF